MTGFMPNISFVPSPSDQANAAVAKKFYEAVLSSDWGGIEKCISKNFILEEAEGVPYRGFYHGLAGLKEVLGKLYDYWGNELEIEINGITAGSGYVVSLITLSGRTNKATGKKFSMPLAEVSKFENNLIARISPYYWDTKALCDPLGDRR